MRIARFAPLLCALLAACAPTRVPVEVTRFWAAPPSAPRSVTIRPAPGTDAGSIVYRVQATAVATALSRLGFQTAPDGAPADIVATVGLVRLTRQPETRRSPVTVGGGLSTGSYGTGVGLGVGIDLSGTPRPMILSRLSVSLSNAGDGAVLWEGRAETIVRQGRAEPMPEDGAARLADALFKDYPGRPGATITVE